MKPTRHKNMTRRWKSKTNSDLLLVIISTILISAGWVKGEYEEFQGDANSVENTSDENQSGQTQIYVGNDAIAEYFFQPSTNDLLSLESMNKCLENFQLITCVKMLLLSRINDVVSLMEEPNAKQKDLNLLNGLLVFKIKNETIGSDEEKKDVLSLDEEIAAKVKRIFRKRSLLINFLPKLKIEIEPAPEEHPGDFVCFRYSVRKESEDKDEGVTDEGRKRKKSGGMSMMMLVPQMIMLGLMPFTLASLKAMVMNAVMINMMALNGAIFMTIRNLVFGPREGDNVKYANYGYSKDRQTQSRRPVLIIHSPAAFVKQPPVHKKHVHGDSSPPQIQYMYFPQNQYSSGDNSQLYQQNAETPQGYEDNNYYYYNTQQSDNQRNKRGQNIERRNYERLNSFTRVNAIRQPQSFQNYQNTNHYIHAHQKSHKPILKRHENNQSNSIYHFGENLKRNPNITHQTLREGNGSEFQPIPKLDALSQKNHNFNSND